jgi:hypothetical protein
MRPCPLQTSAPPAVVSAEQSRPPQPGWQKQRPCSTMPWPWQSRLSAPHVAPVHPVRQAQAPTAGVPWPLQAGGAAAAASPANSTAPSQSAATARTVLSILAPQAPRRPPPARPLHHNGAGLQPAALPTRPRLGPGRKPPRARPGLSEDYKRTPRRLRRGPRSSRHAVATTAASTRPTRSCDDLSTRAIVICSNKLRRLR